MEQTYTYAMLCIRHCPDEILVSGRFLKGSQALWLFRAEPATKNDYLDLNVRIHFRLKLF